jgi:hypothetical protein
MANLLKTQALTEQLKGAGHPVEGLAILPAGLTPEPGWVVAERLDGVKVRLDMAAGATAPQITATVAAVLAATLSDRRPRKLKSIVDDLDALTGTQKTNIWNYINGTVNGYPRWALSDQASVWICMRISGGFAEPTRTLCRILGVAEYIRNEDPNFLVLNPNIVDGLSINVPGDEPVT